MSTIGGGMRLTVGGSISAITLRGKTPWSVNDCTTAVKRVSVERTGDRPNTRGSGGRRRRPVPPGAYTTATWPGDPPGAQQPGHAGVHVLTGKRGGQLCGGDASGCSATIATPGPPGRRGGSAWATCGPR